MLFASAAVVESAPEDDATQEENALTEEQMRENVIRLAFGGDEQRFLEFCETLRNEVPAGTQVVLRGSALTGRRWKNNAPFDHDGPGTSDLDVTMVGDSAIQFYKLTGTYVPGVHSKPISDDAPDIAPELSELREKLTKMAGRPVNLQASRDIVLQFRGDLLGQPYLVLVPKPDPASPLGLNT